MTEIAVQSKADIEAQKLFDKMSNPVIKQYMVSSSIQPKAIVMKSAEHYLNADFGVPGEMARDKHVIKLLNNIPTKYVVGFRAVTMKDVKVAKQGINDLYHDKLYRMRKLMGELLTKSEREEVGDDLAGAQNSYRSEPGMEKYDDVAQSVREKLGL